MRRPSRLLRQKSIGNGTDPEERRKIYEEEKARDEAREQIKKEKNAFTGSTCLEGCAKGLVGSILVVLLIAYIMKPKSSEEAYIPSAPQTAQSSSPPTDIHTSEPNPEIEHPGSVAYTAALRNVIDGLKSANADAQPVITEYALNNAVLEDSEWRGRMGNATEELLDAAMAAENLPHPPNGLKKTDSLLRQAGKEYHRAADALATFVVYRNDDRLGSAADYREKANSLMEQAAAALHDYNESHP